MDIADVKPAMNRGRSRGQVLRVILMGAAVLLILAGAAGGWKFYVASAKRTAEAARQALEAEAETQAQQLSVFFGEVAARLGSLAEDEALIALFEQDNAALVARAAERRIKQFEGGLRLRLLRPGQYELDSEGQPPLGYASLDLLNRAEDSADPVNLEVLLFGSPAQHIVLVERVTDKAGQLVGLLHLSLDVTLPEAAVASLPPVAGYLELQQAARGTQLVLASSGDVAEKAGEPAVSAVAGTRWSVSYWQGSSLPTTSIAGAGLPLGLIFSALLGLLAIGGGVFFLKSRRTAGEVDEASPDEDEDEAETGIVYAGAVLAIMEGAHPGLEKLVPELPDYGQKGRIAPASRPEDREGDDITRIARKDDVRDWGE